MLIDESKESVVALLDVDNFELSKSGFSENGEVVVVGEVARLDVELVEDLSLSDEVGPNLRFGRSPAYEPSGGGDS
jgi:hypothetical protein